MMHNTLKRSKSDKSKNSSGELNGACFEYGLVRTMGSMSVSFSDSLSEPL